MKQLVKDNAIELLAILLVFVNIFLGIVPVQLLILVLVALSLFRTDIIGAYVLSSYALPILLGTSLYVMGITGIATLIQVLLFFICLYKWLVKHNIQFHNFQKGFLYFLAVIFLFLLSVMFSSGGNYAIVKLKETFINGGFVFFAFGFLFSNPQKCNYIRVGLYMILYAFLMLMLSPLLNNGVGPSDFLDFGYLRAQNTLVLDEEKLVVDYQHVGFFATMGCGFIFLETLKGDFSSAFKFLCIGLCTIASLYAGARQFIIISLVFIMLWALFQRKKGISGSIYIILGVALAAIILNTLFADNGLLSSVKEEGYLEGSNRNFILLKGVADFLDNPIFGIGYGRFEYGGRYGLYPHNMFVEILCELGIVGLIILMIIIFKPLKMMIKKEKACLYMFIVFFLRSMTSGGMDSNIMLFSFVFATLCLTSPSNKRIQYKQYDNQRAIA